MRCFQPQRSLVPAFALLALLGCAICTQALGFSMLGRKVSASRSAAGITTGDAVSVWDRRTSHRIVPMWVWRRRSHSSLCRHDEL